MQGKQGVYHDITDFLPGGVISKERLPISGSDSQLILETGPKRPALHKVSLSQWISANVKILDLLITEEAVTFQAIPDYLAYTQKVNRMHDRLGMIEWETVLMYVQEFRQLQASMGMHWGIDVSDIHLRERPHQESHGQARKARANLGNKVRGGSIDPTTGLEICKNFNRNSVVSAIVCLPIHAPDALKHTLPPPMTREIGASARQQIPVEVHKGGHSIADYISSWEHEFECFLT